MRLSAQPLGISSLALLATEGSGSVLQDSPFSQVSCPLPRVWLDTRHHSISGDRCRGDRLPDRASSQLGKAVAAGLTGGHGGPTERSLEAESVCLSPHGEGDAVAQGPSPMLMPRLCP